MKRKISKKKVRTRKKVWVRALTDRDKHWTHGFACAARLVADFDGKSTAQTICREGGFSKQALLDAECEQSDIDAIFPEDEDVTE